MASVVKRLRGNKTKRQQHKDVGNYLNKQRTLVFSTRGIVHRDRHLMTDLRDLLPHSRKETKLDSKGKLSEVKEVADMKNCNNVIFFEARKFKDLYMWISRCPGGPTARFLVQNIHTMSEIKLTGNCLKGSRPILQFDQSFNDTPHGVLLKEMLTQSFGSPKGHPRVKPFVDHIFSFFLINGRIHFRNYQVSHDGNDNTVEEGKPLLIEIGPRFTLVPVKIFDGCFGGNVLWENPEYVSPNVVRAMMKTNRGSKYVERHESKRQRGSYVDENQLEKGEFADLFA